jgi:hypothetical protein
LYNYEEENYVALEMMKDSSSYKNKLSQFQGMMHTFSSVASTRDKK